MSIKLTISFEQKDTVGTFYTNQNTFWYDCAYFKQKSKGIIITVHNILKNKSLVAILVAIVTFIVFLPALQNEFINLDDTEYVCENPFIRSLDTRLLKSAFWGSYAANWHPLTWISHAIDYSIWGLNPLGHHLTNNILHALNTLIVVFLVMQLMEFLRKTKGNNGLSQSFLNDHTIGITGAVTGLLFGLHPLHVESVAWIAERKDLLCAFFFLLSILMYMGYAGDKSGPGRPFLKRQYLIALGFFTLALLSKPMAVSLPFVLLILDWYLFRRIQSLKTFGIALVEKLPFFALMFVSSILTLLAQKLEGSMGMMQSVPLSTRVLVGAHSLIAYLGKMVLPINLVPFYPYPKNISPISLEYILPIVILVGITVTCLSVMRKQKLWLTAWGYYVITLLPVIGIVQVGGQAMADRYTYLPSLGPFLIIGLIAAKAYEKVTALNQRGVILKITGLFIATAVLISISFATIRQIGIWKDSIVFMNYVIGKEHERVPWAYSNLGNAYLAKGLLDKAIEQFHIALRLKPNLTEAYYNLGSAYSSKGQLDMAIEQYKIALRLKPDYVKAHYNLGNAYLAKGQLDMAIEQYKIALQLNPDNIEAHNNLGSAYSSRGQLDMAIEEYKVALRLKPEYAEAHFNLGSAYSSRGQLDMAIEKYKAALRLKPDLTVAHYNLGSAYSSNGQLDMATEEYKIVLRLKPDYAEAHFNLGLIYLNNGSRDKARTEFELGLRINPDDYRAREVLNSLISN